MNLKLLDYSPSQEVVTIKLSSDISIRCLLQDFDKDEEVFKYISCSLSMLKKNAEQFSSHLFNKRLRANFLINIMGYGRMLHAVTSRQNCAILPSVITGNLPQWKTLEDDEYSTKVLVNSFRLKDSEKIA